MDFKFVGSPLRLGVSERVVRLLANSFAVAQFGALGIATFSHVSVIELATVIHAPIDRVFDLARSIDLHTDSTSSTGERAVAGVTSGLIGLGDEVTWRARHFGVWQTLTVRITAFERPSHFADIMLRGAFRRMEHRHDFEASSGVTTMRDTFSFESPLGFLGRLIVLFLKRYMRSFLIERNQVIKATAESDDWIRYIRSA